MDLALNRRATNLDEKGPSKRKSHPPPTTETPRRPALIRLIKPKTSQKRRSPRRPTLRLHLRQPRMHLRQPSTNLILRLL